MSNLNNKRFTLVLNKHFSPLAIVGAKKCMKYFLNDAKALDPVSYEQFSFDEWVSRSNVDDGDKTISTVRYYIMIPEILILDRETIRKKRADQISGVSKVKVFNRDSWLCGYCSEQVTSKTATIDHVIPTSLGGTNTYDNVVTCCSPCNTKKADNTLEHMKKKFGWQLKHALDKPSSTVVERIPKGKILDCWKPYLSGLTN
jgi:hypothetical protein